MSNIHNSLVNTEQIPFGTIIDNRYLIQQILGQGGLGRTYLAFDTHRFNEPCVLKEFAPLGSGQYDLEKSRDLFKREARILHHITHPQIPKFLACFEGHGRLFLVQEYVTGKTYSALLQQRHRENKTFTELEVVKWLMSLLPILEYIHNLGIIHRDISPDNIMQPDGEELPVLIDFGVGKLTTGPAQDPSFQSHSYVGKMSFVGKIGYAPREQISMGRCSPSSDIYALGVTALVLLSGKEPTALLDQYSLEWQWHKLVQISLKLTRILTKMTEERPVQRYQSAQEILIELKNNYPVSEYPFLAQSSVKKPITSKSSSFPLNDDGDTVIVPPTNSNFHSRPAGNQTHVVNPTPIPQPEPQYRPETSFVKESNHHTAQDTMIVSSGDHGRLKSNPNHPPNQQQPPQYNSSGSNYYSPSNRASSVNTLNSNFIKRCQQELAYSIGPMASLIIQEIIQEQAPHSQEELVEAVMQQIPDMKKAMEFKQRLFKN